MDKKIKGEDLKGYFKDIYPHVWEHYKFLYDRRIVDTHNRFDFLLLMNTLILILLLQFFPNLLEMSKYFYVTLVLLTLPIITYFIYILTPRIFVPWFEKEEIRNIWDNGENEDFYENGLRSIYGVAPSLWIYIKRRSLLYRFSINLLLLGIFSIPSIFILFSFPSYFITILLALTLFIVLINTNLNKSLKNPTNEVEEFFDKMKENIPQKHKKEIKDNTNEIRDFNKGVFMGLVGGLLVYWSQIATNEMATILNLPLDNYLIKMFMGLLFAIFIFIVFASTNFIINKNRN